MLSVVEIDHLKGDIQALDDEDLIAEAVRLRSEATGISPKLEAKWDAMIAEAVSDLEKPLKLGGKKEARGRLRSFCLNRRKHSGSE